MRATSRRPGAALAGLVLVTATASLAQDGGGARPNSVEDARDALRKRFLAVEAWYGRFRIEIRGSGSRSEGSSSESYSVHRAVEVVFRIPMSQPEAQAIAGMEEMVKASPQMARLLGPEYAKLRDARNWMSEMMNRRPEDEDDIRLLVADRRHASGVEGCGGPHPWERHSSLDGAETRKGAGFHHLKIDVAAGTYDLRLDDQAQALAITARESGPPATSSVNVKSASGVPMRVDGRQLPQQGRVISDSMPMSREQLISASTFANDDYGSLDGRISWTLSPEPIEDVELVLRPESYDDWLPRGGPDEATLGNAIRVTAALRRRDGGGPPKAKIDRIAIRIEDGSREPGVCLNRPLGSGATSPDLKLAAAGATVEEEGAHLRKEGVGAVELPFTVECYDWGAWGELVAEATLTDGRWLKATLAGDPSASCVRLPKRPERSKVADRWKADVGAAGAADDEDRDKQGGNRNDGDGLTLYEEYRGLFAEGNHTRNRAPGPDRVRTLSPLRKDLVVHDTIRHALGGSVRAGLGLFETASGIHVVRVDEGELDASRRVNLNAGRITAGPQHGLRLFNESAASGDSVGESHGLAHQRIGSPQLGGSPAGWEKIVIDLAAETRAHAAVVSACRALGIAPPKTLPESVAATVAHELAHGVGVKHHGGSDEVRFATRRIEAGNPLVIYDRDGSVISKPFDIAGAIGEPHNDSSGDVSCITCYNNVWTWSYHGGAIHAAPIVGGNTIFCTSGQPTGPNAPRPAPGGAGTLPGVFGSASRGDCLGGMRVKDQP